MTESGNFFNKTSKLPDINMDKKLPSIKKTLPKVDLKLFEDDESVNIEEFADTFSDLYYHA